MSFQELGHAIRKHVCKSLLKFRSARIVSMKKISTKLFYPSLKNESKHTESKSSLSISSIGSSNSNRDAVMHFMMNNL